MQVGSGSRNTAAALNPSCTAITDAFAYDAYGNTVASVTSALPTPWRYQGRILESAANTPDLYDFGARSYSPALGAFTSLDTSHGSAQNPHLLNGYLYADANPTTLVDPDGHCARVVGDDCINGTGRTQVDRSSWADYKGPPIDWTAVTARRHLQKLRSNRAGLEARLQGDQAKADENARRLNTLNLVNAANFFALGFEVLGLIPTGGADEEQLTGTWDEIAAAQSADQMAFRELPMLEQNLAADSGQLGELDSALANFGARGNDFMAGSTRGFDGEKLATERDTAAYLAETRGAQVDKIPEPNGTAPSGVTTPDAMVRMTGDDVGTATELGTLNGNSANSVKNMIGDKSSQLGGSAYGTGNVVIDGRGVGLTRDAAQQGLNDQLRYGLGHIQQVIIILGDGSALTYP
jgi:RHS repeat-associated protein